MNDYLLGRQYALGHLFIHKLITQPDAHGPDEWNQELYRLRVRLQWLKKGWTDDPFGDRILPMETQ